MPPRIASIARLLAFAALVQCASGCFLFLSPPVRVSLGAGASVGSLNTPGDTSAPVQLTSGASTFRLRGSLQPLQMLEAMRDRHIDVGVGYGADFARPTTTVIATTHGPYAELGGFPFRGPNWRLGFHAAADLPMIEAAGGRLYGFGATLSSTLEATSWVESSGTGSSNDRSGFGATAGAWQGEVAIGVEAFTTVRSIDGAVSIVAGIGFALRLPATVAIGIIIPDPTRTR